MEYTTNPETNPVTAELFMVDHMSGPVSENDLDAVKDKKAFLTADREAGIVITSGTQELTIRDGLDELIMGVCVAGGEVLHTNGLYMFISFSGHGATEISVEDSEVHFTSGDEALHAPKKQVLLALNELCARYLVLLKTVFPDGVARRSGVEEYLDSL